MLKARKQMHRHASRNDSHTQYHQEHLAMDAQVKYIHLFSFSTFLTLFHAVVVRLTYFSCPSGTTMVSGSSVDLLKMSLLNLVYKGLFQHICYTLSHHMCLCVSIVLRPVL